MSLTPAIRSPRALLVSLLAVPAIALGLAGCATPAPEETAPSGSSSSAPRYDDYHEWQLAMAECLRGEGIDVPDLDDDGGVVKGESADYDTEAFEVAQQKCADEVGTPPAASERKQSGGGDDFAEFTRKAVECYREKGYEVVDPAPNEPLAVPSDAPEEVVAECGGQAMKIGG